MLKWLIAWKARKSFHVASGTLPTRAALPVMAVGCQTMKSVCLPRPAAWKKVFQSRPGALLAKSCARQALLPLATSAESSRLAWLAAICCSSANTRAARAGASL
ncbi:hypothetical protein D3C72_1580150 [compost metagenome]